MASVINGTKMLRENLQEGDTDDRGHAKTREEAEVEWTLVPNIIGRCASNKRNINLSLASPVVTVEEAVQHFRSLDLPKQCAKISSDKSKLAELVCWLKFPHLNEELHEEVILLNSQMQSGLNWSDKVQFRAMQTLYRKLSGAKIDCPQRGSHWQLIGFQGNDPATDFRGVGLFGLLQFLYLTSEDLLPLGHRLYKVANSDTQPFPLAVLSLNVTNIVWNIFNSGKLNRECNNRKSVITTLNSFYAALMVFIFNIWITQKKTIKDSGYLLKDAEKYCGKNVKKVLKDLSKNLLKYEK
ncbi:ELMO domain-containing protein 3-like [Cimex lectularius]|uniref:ELMO domain-containing protein n=1 Tax=Cimex lectularius TaxID=79782 RepID=A0A8I6REA8_CIMLE|nr:ELMO domain-containing protein 3-like [Cimex lectularius]XP_014242230.1 ELMO domain-containing protein 3-like [Cimex lectularius]